MITLYNVGILFISFVMSGEKVNPPGTVRLEDHKYIDQSEISNFEWKEYLIWLKQRKGENSVEYSAAFPQNESWKGLYKIDFSLNSITKENMNSPVVGISYKQALDYCKWRTERVNEKLQWKYWVEYRLPTEAEYQDAIQAEKNTSNQFFNENYNLYSIPSKTQGMFTLFLSSNVSELTNREGLAFGGNFSDKSNELKEYKEPQKWLGFRCIAETK